MSDKNLQQRAQIDAAYKWDIGQLVSPCCHKITSMLFLLFYCIFGFCAIYI